MAKKVKEEQKEAPAEQKQEEQQPKLAVKSTLAEERVITENSDAARELYSQSRYGALLENGKVQLSLLEALYLLEKGRLEILDSRNKPLDFEKFLKKAQKTAKRQE